MAARSLRELLFARLARARNDTRATVAHAAELQKEARALTEQTATARRLRWTIRYERAFERKTAELGDLRIRD
jgi:hypothetical protein